MVSFLDRSLRLKSTPRVQVASTFRTEFTSHISLYRGAERPTFENAFHKPGNERMAAKMNTPRKHSNRGQGTTCSVNTAVSHTSSKEVSKEIYAIL